MGRALAPHRSQSAWSPMEALDVPRAPGRPRLPSRETLLQRAERLARLLGTPKYLVGQSIALVAWLLLNILLEKSYLSAHPHCIHLKNGVAVFDKAARCSGGIRPLDPYPFTLLTLLLSLQAAYAAPFILLAQYRSRSRDLVSESSDRDAARRQRASTDYLIREAARIRDATARALRRSDLVDTLRDRHDA